MNVTLKLPDELCRRARHRAVDESKSLSAWVADLVDRELRATESSSRPSLLESLGDESLAEKELPLPDRRDAYARDIAFP